MMLKPWPKIPVSKPDKLSETAAPPRQAPLEINVRAAKDKLSSLLKMAADGAEIVITRDGLPQARLVSVRPVRKKFKTDWALLRSTRRRKGAHPTEEIIRQERDGRP